MRFTAQEFTLWRQGGIIDVTQVKNLAIIIITCSTNILSWFSLMPERLPTTDLAFIDPKYCKPQYVNGILFLECLIMSKKYCSCFYGKDKVVVGKVEDGFCSFMTVLHVIGNHSTFWTFSILQGLKYFID